MAPRLRALIYGVPTSPECEKQALSPTMLASLSNLFVSPRGRYRLIATFNDNLRGVNSLSFSKDGQYLASGGEYTFRSHKLRPLTCREGGDGVKVWDLRTRLHIPTPPHRENLGPVTKALWIGGSDAVYPTLCYGTGLGYLCLLNQGAKSVSNGTVFTNEEWTHLLLSGPFH